MNCQHIFHYIYNYKVAPLLKTLFYYKNIYIYNYLSILGWGVTSSPSSSDKGSDVLMDATVKIVPKDECKKPFYKLV